MIKALIFDLDGVVVDTAKYHYLAWKKIAEELGFDFTEKDNERLKGVSRMHSLEILLEIGGIELSEAEKLKLMENKNRDYLSYIYKMTPDEILPGVIQILKIAKEKGLKTAIGSVSKNAKVILEKINLISYFDSIIDGLQISKGKPDPEVFLKGAQELNVKPEECLVFEDSEAGIEAAIKGSMHVVGIGEKETLGKAEMVVPGFENIELDTFLKLGEV
jgi:beta-phosphoglucomutase